MNWITRIQYRSNGRLTRWQCVCMTTRATRPDVAFRLEGQINVSRVKLKSNSQRTDAFGRKELYVVCLSISRSESRARLIWKSKKKNMMRCYMQTFEYYEQKWKKRRALLSSSFSWLALCQQGSRWLEVVGRWNCTDRQWMRKRTNAQIVNVTCRSTALCCLTGWFRSSDQADFGKKTNMWPSRFRQATASKSQFTSTRQDGKRCQFEMKWKSAKKWFT